MSHAFYAKVVFKLIRREFTLSETVWVQQQLLTKTKTCSCQLSTLFQQNIMPFSVCSTLILCSLDATVAAIVYCYLVSWLNCQQTQQNVTTLIYSKSFIIPTLHCKTVLFIFTSTQAHTEENVSRRFTGQCLHVSATISSRLIDSGCCGTTSVGLAHAWGVRCAFP